MLSSVTNKMLYKCILNVIVAKYVVPEINVNEGRKLRSANKKPAMKRAGTMQTTAAAGKEYLKRSKKAKTSGDSSEED